MRYLVIWVTLALFACGGDANAPGASIAGTWQFSGNMTDAVHSLSCTAAGLTTITQNGDQFSGTVDQQGTCSGPGGTIDNSGTGSITGGQVNGQSLSFQALACQYQGSASGSPANQLEGTSTCSFADAGVTYTFVGNWQAGR